MPNKTIQEKSDKIDAVVSAVMTDSKKFNEFKLLIEKYNDSNSKRGEIIKNGYNFTGYDKGKLLGFEDELAKVNTEIKNFLKPYAEKQHLKNLDDFDYELIMLEIKHKLELGKQSKQQSAIKLDVSEHSLAMNVSPSNPPYGTAKGKNSIV
jgi:hypothetical protein